MVIEDGFNNQPKNKGAGVQEVDVLSTGFRGYRFYYFKRGIEIIF